MLLVTQDRCSPKYHKDRRVPGMFCPQTPILTFPVRFEVTVDWRGLDFTQPPVALRHGSSFVQGEGGRGQPHQVEVMRSWAHGDVEILGVVVGFLGVDQGRGTGVHGDVVVLGVGAVGAGHHGLGLLGDKWEDIESVKTLLSPSL